MKKIVTLLLLLSLSAGLFACTKTPGPEKPAVSSVVAAKTWLEKQLENNNLFSFDYNGKAYSTFIESWTKNIETGTDEDGNATWTLTYTSSDGVTAWAEISFDEEYSALDWCCYFKNEGAADSPVISNIQALDSVYEISSPVLTSAKGSDAAAYDFEPFSVDLTEQPEHTLRSSGGRSSQGGFPYFDIANGKTGILGAIGWTGNWKATFTNENGKVSMCAGMPETNISLHSNEDMRTPSIVLTFFNGDQDAGHNQFRRLILKSYTPSDETGEPLKNLPYTINTWGGWGADELLGIVDLHESTGLRYELLWIDAGWYGDRSSSDTFDAVWTTEVGNWYPYAGSFPDGLKPIADKLEAQDKGLLLWFEPERAMEGTTIVREYPEYVLPATDTSSFYLVDFSRDDATDYMIDLIDNLIKENNVSWYRQDFNCDPYNKWVLADEKAGENRTGITEIKYITNHYRYLQALIDRNPGLVIDNCASGGKRLDIEMMKLSVPLWRTDYSVTTSSSVNADGVRSIGYNLTWWLPLSCGGNTRDGLTTNYNWRCVQSSGMTVVEASNDRQWHFEMIEQYYRCRELMIGDYYILTAGTGDNYNKENAVYEFYLPETGEGYIMAFRPAASGVAEQICKLKGLDADATYQLEVVDTGEVITATGVDLMEGGLAISLGKSYTSQLIFITKQ